MKLVDRLDRYCAPDLFNDSPLLGALAPRTKRKRRRSGAPEGAVGGCGVPDAPRDPDPPPTDENIVAF